MAAGDIERAYWARAWAKAILEAHRGNHSFKTKLETDPFLAYRQVTGEFGPLLNPMVADLSSYEADIGEKVSLLPDDRLEKIIKKEGGEVLKMDRNELKKV